jgi:hypothetical protein
MEIQVYTPTQAQPLPVVEWNYDEVKKWVEDGLQAYKGRVYTNDMIAQAKKDRANLNKLATAIATKRREMKSMYLAPYEQFDAEAKEIEGMIKTVSAEIDAQVKAADEFRKNEKRRYIEEHIYAPIIGILSTLVPYEKLHDPKWLNVTTSPNEIRQAMAAKVEKIESGLKAIEQLGLDADVAERVNSVFMNTFDLAVAIAEKDRIMGDRERMARYKAEQEAAQQAQQAQTAEVAPKAITAPAVEEKPAQPVEQPPADEKILTVKFCIHVTKAQLDGLGAYMKANGIKPERI